MFQVKALITDEKLKIPIQCCRVETWVEELLNSFHKTEGLKSILVNRERQVAEIVYELLPLSKYINAYFKKSDHLLYFYPGSAQSFDAEIKNKAGNLIEKIEVTMAIDGQSDKIKTECSIVHGIAPVIKTPEYSGNAKNRKISADTTLLAEPEDVINHYKDLIQSAFNKKHENLYKYPNTVLLIAFEVRKFFLDKWEFDEIIKSLNIPNNTFNKVVVVNISSDQYWLLKEK